MGARMEKLNLGHVPQLSIQEMTILPIETLLELAREAEEAALAAYRQRSWINGAIAIKELRNEKAKSGEQL
jgi:hypothetical protein